MSWISVTKSRIVSIDVRGNSLLSSHEQRLDSSARSANPSSAKARNKSGTNESSAKYAIIAARWVPRSAKNLAKTALTGREYHCVSFGP